MTNIDKYLGKTDFNNYSYIIYFGNIRKHVFNYKGLLAVIERGKHNCKIIINNRRQLHIKDSGCYVLGVNGIKSTNYMLFLHNLQKTIERYIETGEIRPPMTKYNTPVEHYQGRSNDLRQLISRLVIDDPKFNYTRKDKARLLLVLVNKYLQANTMWRNINLTLIKGNVTEEEREMVINWVNKIDSDRKEFLKYLRDYHNLELEYGVV